MKILLNMLTHGNEVLGLDVAREISKLGLTKDVLTIQRANEKAYQLRKRYIDQDLNRSFPGKKNGNHEEQIAYRLSPIVKSADVVIDIHSTTSTLKDALIVTKLNQKTLQCIQAMQPKYVLVMNATKKSALISQAKVGIGFEYGRNNEKSTLNKVVADMKRLFNFLQVTSTPLPRKKTPTTYFTVVATVPKPPGYKLLAHVDNYKLIQKGEVFAQKGKKYIRASEDFYPLLFRQRAYIGYFGFMGIQKDPKKK